MKHLAPALAALAVLGTAGVAAAAPNLQPVIDPSTDPAAANPLAVAHWRVETTASPYTAHFFYGAAIENTGADDLIIQAKALSTTGDTATAQQVIGATPPTDLDPAKVAVKSIGAPNPGHTNWGVTNVFGIALTPSGGTAIPSARDVFCWASGGPYTTATCSTANDQADGFLSGIAGAGGVDSVPVGTEGAYFDITGVAPAAATVVQTVNPTGEIDEEDTTDNATSPVPVQIPGVTAEGAAATTQAGKAVAVPLKATIAAPEVLGTPAGGTAAPADPGNITYAAANGAHGAVTVSGSTATYTPAAGFTGADSFTFTATDSRGLRSAAATVTVQVAAATTPTTPTTPKPPTPGPGNGGSSPAKFTLTARQLLINQRIGQAAIRRLAAVQAKLDGKPAPRFPNSGKRAGAVRLDARQLLINQRIYQAAIRRAATLEARLDRTPAPTFGERTGGTVTLTVRQLRVNQRIAQAAVRRANALQTRVGI